MEKPNTSAEMAVKTKDGVSNVVLLTDLLGTEPDVSFTSVAAAIKAKLPQSVIDRLKWGR